MISWFALLAALLPFVSSFRHLHPRTHTTCEQWGVLTISPYSLMSNLWGSSDGDGRQCATVDSVNNNIIKWSTTYAWWDSTSIISFTNIQLDEGLNQQLSAISSIPSTWSWTQSNEDVVADVAYDLFTSDTPGGSNVVEVMVWLANMNAGPISHEYDASGHAVPIASNFEINGYYWNLYCGSNGYNVVYSFLPASGNINNWSGDIYAFFNYLLNVNKQPTIDSSQYLKTAQAGTEVTSGSATFVTSAYSLTVN